MKNIKKNFIKKYKTLKEWRKKKTIRVKVEKLISTVSRSVRLAYRTAMSFVVLSMTAFIGNALYESIMELKSSREERN